MICPTKDCELSLEDIMRTFSVGLNIYLWVMFNCDRDDFKTVPSTAGLGHDNEEIE